jgi:NodT family efflux transporter outer membrane factor (OMF) lipoprotein
MQRKVYTICSFCWLSLTVLLCGCAGKYASEPLTSAIASAEDVARTHQLNTAWWLGYGSPELNQLVSLALARNVDLALSAIAVNKALYSTRRLRTDLLPAFSASASASSTANLAVNQNSQYGQTQSGDQSWKGEGSVKYELDLWQRLRNASDAADWEHKATVEDLHSARLALIHSVVEAWFTLLYTKQALAVTQKSFDDYQRILSVVQSRYALGKATPEEPLQAEQALLSTQNSLANLRIQQAEALQTLRNLLNLHPNEEVALGQKGLLALPALGVDLTVPIAALGARPDIHAAEARVQKAFKTVQSDQAAWYPRISVGSTLSLSADSAQTFFNVPLLAGLVSLSLPFLDWNTLYWNVKISEADFESAKLELVKSVTTALNEVDAACAAYVQAQHIVRQTQAEHQRSLRIAQYYKMRYEQGSAALKDYLEVQASAFTAEVNMLAAKKDLISRENNIYKAVGGRYEPKPAALAQ